MTAKKVVAPAAKRGGHKKPDTDTVSRKEFGELSESVTTLADGVADLVGMIKSGALGKKEEVETAEQKEIAKAAPNKYSENAEWDEMAREIVGAAVDHTEVAYVKGGGTLFTIVVKEEFSNAPLDYLARHKVDRRSKEIGSTGDAGVREWCTLVRDNLKKGRPMVVEN